VRLEFESLPLAEVVTEFNLRNRQQLIIGDAATGRLRVGGSFRADNVDAFVRLLEATFGVIAERRADGSLLLRREEQARGGQFFCAGLNGNDRPARSQSPKPLSACSMTTPSPFLRRALMATLALVLSVCAFAADTAKKAYQLPAGDAAVTLKRFSEQSGEQIVYPVDAVRGVQTNAVNGDFSARDALDRLVAGTELRIVRDEKTGALAVNRAAAGNGYGEISGRVFNPASGSYVNNARVTVDAYRLETFTDDYGNFRFPRVPVGDAAVRVFYTGFPPETQSVKVVAGQPTEQDFTLRAKNDTTMDKTVKLDAFKVAANRDMAASDVAVNEQRYSASIKNVVATDLFRRYRRGQRGRVCEVSARRNPEPQRQRRFSISLGGVPSGATPIMVDGNPLSSAASSGGSRTVELRTDLHHDFIARRGEPFANARLAGQRHRRHGESREPQRVRAPQSRIHVQDLPLVQRRRLQPVQETQSLRQGDLPV